MSDQIRSLQSARQGRHIHYKLQGTHNGYMRLGLGTELAMERIEYDVGITYIC